jgi:hypothetical protein
MKMDENNKNENNEQQKIQNKKNKQPKIKNHSKIGSVSEYLNVISRNNLIDYISRGEKRKYPEITSKACRETGQYYHYRKLMDEFGKIVFKDLTVLQKEHFLAFCQHYGMPTNLIDFTHSPLVSLFFACYSDPNEKPEEQENGFVYFVEQWRTDDITELITDNNFLGIKALLDYKSKHLSVIRYRVAYKLLIQFLQDNLRKLASFNFDSDSIEEIKSSHNSWLEVKKSIKKINPGIIHGLKETKKAVSEHPLFEHPLLKLLKNIMDENQKLDSPIMDIAKHIYEKAETFESYYDILQIYLSFYLMLLSLLSKNQDFKLDFLYTYNPPQIVDRMSAQHSIFVYQFYQGYRSCQKIEPDYTIEIDGNKKDEILYELDCLGINLKTIYGDFDSVAKYIIEKETAREKAERRTIEKYEKERNRLERKRIKQEKAEKEQENELKRIEKEKTENNEKNKEQEKESEKTKIDTDKDTKN